MLSFVDFLDFVQLFAAGRILEWTVCVENCGTNRSIG